MLEFRGYRPRWISALAGGLVCCAVIVCAAIQRPAVAADIAPLVSAPDAGENRRLIAAERIKLDLEEALATADLKLGAPVFIRVFKESKELELWLMRDYEFRLLKTFPICAVSGGLGPKLKEGDRQAPEGFYGFSAERLNPDSDFYLSINLGFPNRFDRAHKRTGTKIMIHGGCVSSGCFAMTDRGMSEIYTVVDAALRNGQSLIQVHIFPFRMTEENMLRHASSGWSGFWRNLKEGSDYFERTGRPPVIAHSYGRYTFSPILRLTAEEQADGSSSACVLC